MSEPSRPHVNVPSATDPGYFVLTAVTPELAREWLEKKTRNRNVTRNRVLDYTKQILAGQWQITHQGIAFSLDENQEYHLTDGQHRLQAVIEADQAVHMWVYYGLPQSAMIVVDKHRPRSEHNSLYISGYDYGRKQVIVARNLYLSEYRQMQSAGGKIHGEELVKFLQFHEKAINFACELFRHNQRGLSCSAVVVAVTRAYYTQDHARLTQFVEQLYSGMPEHPREDEAVIRLRNYLLTVPAIGAGTHLQMVYRKTLSAVQAYMERRSLASLRETNTDVFPIPQYQVDNK